MIKPNLTLFDMFILVQSFSVILVLVYFAFSMLTNMKEAEAFEKLFSDTKKKYVSYFGKKTLKLTIKTTRALHFNRGAQLLALQDGILEEATHFQHFINKCRQLPQETQKDILFAQHMYIVEFEMPIKSFRLWAEQNYFHGEPTI